MLASQELLFSLELISCLILEIKNNVVEKNHCYKVCQCAILGTRSTCSGCHLTSFPMKSLTPFLQPTCSSNINTPPPLHPHMVNKLHTPHTSMPQPEHTVTSEHSTPKQTSFNTRITVSNKIVHSATDRVIR